VQLVLVFLLWTALMIAVASQFPKDINGGLAFGIMIALGALAMSSLVWLIRWQNRRRARRMRDTLASRGLTVEVSPTERERQATLERLGKLALLREAPDEIHWIARGSVDGQPVTALRHAYLAGSGRYAREHVSTVVAMPIGDPRPGLWLMRTNFSTTQRNLDSGYRQDVQIGDAWFDKNFRIMTHDADAPGRILTNPVKQHIANGPWRESWTVGWGWVVCIFGADTNADGIAAMIRRTRTLAELVASHAPASGLVARS
jgi:hypothetical protein